MTRIGTHPATRAYSKMTYEDAINALVEFDVARWGENERQASRRVHLAHSKTLGLALNSLANRFGDEAPAELISAAKAALSNPIPKNVMNELLDLRAMVSTSSAAFSDAINDKAEEYEVSKGSLRKYIEKIYDEHERKYETT